MKGLQGKNVLVTGSSSGIGQSIAVRFAQERANVAVNYRKSLASAQQTEEMIAQCCQDCGVKAILVQADVANEHDVLRMFDEVIREFGTIDVLVNNSGIQISAMITTIFLNDNFLWKAAGPVERLFFCEQLDVNGLLFRF